MIKCSNCGVDHSLHGVAIHTAVLVCLPSDVINHRDHQLARAKAEIERLRAIVDGLPKTADGVPIYPGMTVYRQGAHTGKIHARVAYMKGPPMVDSYSTRDAAEAAKAAGPEGEQP